MLHRLQSVDKEIVRGGGTEGKEEDGGEKKVRARYGLSCARNNAMLVTGGAAAHFLASAISRGHLKAIDVSAAGIKTNKTGPDAGADGPVLLENSLFAQIMSASPYVNALVSKANAAHAKPEDLDALHGYVRLAQALLGAGMLSQNAAQAAQTSAKALLAWLLAVDTSALKTLASSSLTEASSLSVVDVRAYNQRSRVFLMDALVEFAKQDDGSSPFVQINAALVCLPLVLPGDEAIASTVSAWRGSTCPRTAPRRRPPPRRRRRASRGARRPQTPRPTTPKTKTKRRQAESYWAATRPAR